MCIKKQHRTFWFFIFCWNCCWISNSSSLKWLLWKEINIFNLKYSSFSCMYNFNILYKFHLFNSDVVYIRNWNGWANFCWVHLDEWVHESIRCFKCNNLFILFRRISYIFCFFIFSIFFKRLERFFCIAFDTFGCRNFLFIYKDWCS